ncbi:hypothetical protein ACE38W_14930 [Chitinophaga sp. Hz27]|uniref:hypothetical protein n=1 Tax=Chitinophaga sp. Hz27 TaxID=3347169 RepID=UPI0035E3932D
MAGIKAPIVDILNRLKEIDSLQFIRIWNSQLEYLEDGGNYDFPKPAAFLEVIPGAQFDALLMGFASADLVFRIHLVHEYYDAQNGTFEQDLVVFDLRDSIVKSLTLFAPNTCGALTLFSEGQDFDHNNIYHYTVDFYSNFIDSTGSPLDPNSGKFITKDPPTSIVINSQIVDAIVGVEANANFPHPEYKPYIPQK